MWMQEQLYTLCSSKHIIFAVLFSLMSPGSADERSTKQPNIIFILADDLGYNDVPWHNPSIVAPNLAELAAKGVVLEQYYTQSLCSPSRAALLTGLYPIRTGRQTSIIRADHPIGLFTNFTLLPEYLNTLGYQSHMVGKWHLGFCNSSYLPLNRGFKTFYGSYSAGSNYFTHHHRGYDMFRNLEADLSANGTYSLYLHNDEAIKIIQSQEKHQNPLFLYLAFQNIHRPLQLPAHYKNVYPKNWPDKRRIGAGMITLMDEAIGNITRALKAAGLYEQTLLVFTSDNGAPVEFGGNNFPLRGAKNTLWEGGHRVPALIHAPFLPVKIQGSIFQGLFHVTDWLPTLYTAAGGNELANEGAGHKFGKLDGVDQWQSMLNGTKSARHEFIYNINPMRQSPYNYSAAIRIGHMKLIRGLPSTDKHDGWYDQLSTHSPNNSGQNPGLLLFNLTSDPLEKTDLSARFPAFVRHMLDRIEKYEEEMIPPNLAKKHGCYGNPAKKTGILGPGWCQAVPGQRKSFFIPREPCIPSNVEH